jgi:adenylate cyclase class 2
MAGPERRADADGMQAQANLEIKARCADLSALRERVARLATRRIGVDRQLDTYFATRSGRLKLRASSLSGGQLIPYERPDASGPRRSDYRVVPVEDADRLARMLGEILGVRCVVRKEREIFLYGNVRIHLDRVEGLGPFVELEAVFDGSPQHEAEQLRRLRSLMKELGIRDRDLVAGSYADLVAG